MKRRQPQLAASSSLAGQRRALKWLRLSGILPSVSAPRYACAVSSCTTALHLALIAAGVGSGDEVITVSHSFIATANSVRYCGAIPVFVDIRADQFNIDPDLIEAAITPLTKAIVCVHQIGMPCGLARIVRIAAKHSISLIEDAACAIGSEILWDGKWERVGKPHGDVACFSFHPRKILSTGDGGMITTRHKEWDAKFRLLRQHGMAVPDTVRHASSSVIFESYPEIGFNYRMTDIQAAVGREQLKRLPEFLSRRREIARTIVSCWVISRDCSFQSSPNGREAIGRVSVFACRKASLRKMLCRRSWTGASQLAEESCAHIGNRPISTRNGVA
jgi:dTDP-4-amino-4,6-dideoxygalactose transaminase